MTRTVMFAALAALSFTAPAKAEITTLGECYDAVITWCNETFPDHDCSHPSGLDDCDEEFGNAEAKPGFNSVQFMARVKRASIRIGANPMDLKRSR